MFALVALLHIVRGNPPTNPVRHSGQYFTDSGCTSYDASFTVAVALWTKKLFQTVNSADLKIKGNSVIKTLQ